MVVDGVVVYNSAPHAFIDTEQRIFRMRENYLTLTWLVLYIIIPFGVYHRLKGPITFNFFFRGGIFNVSKTTFFRFDGGWRKFGSSENATTKHTSCLTQLKAACTISRILTVQFFFTRPFRTSTLPTCQLKTCIFMCVYRFVTSFACEIQNPPEKGIEKKRVVVLKILAN